jgi:hypothetical protein
MTEKKQQSSWKQVLTPEHGQIRPKHVVVLKILKWEVLRTLKSVLDIDKPHKRRKKKSESEITMCDRMQMYNNTILKYVLK